MQPFSVVLLQQYLRSFKKMTWEPASCKVPYNVRSTYCSLFWIVNVELHIFMWQINVIVMSKTYIHHYIPVQSIIIHCDSTCVSSRISRLSLADKGKYQRTKIVVYLDSYHPLHWFLNKKEGNFSTLNATHWLLTWYHCHPNKSKYNMNHRILPVSRRFCLKIPKEGTSIKIVQQSQWHSLKIDEFNGWRLSPVVVWRAGDTKGISHQLTN